MERGAKGSGGVQEIGNWKTVMDRQVVKTSVSFSLFFPCKAKSVLMVGNRKHKNSLKKTLLRKPDNSEREVIVDSEE